jgi:hypothetical protein
MSPVADDELTAAATPLTHLYEFGVSLCRLAD